MTSLLTQWRPSNGAPVAKDFFDRFFDEAFRNPFSLARASEDVGADWLPRLDIAETDAEYRFTADVPGLKKEDVSIAIEDNVLTLSGERKFEKDKKKENYHRVERSYGKFTRSFTLPASVDAAKASAEFKDGVLTVRVPKAETAKVRKVEIR